MNPTRRDDLPGIKQGMGLFDRYLSVWVAVVTLPGKTVRDIAHLTNV